MERLNGFKCEIISVECCRGGSTSDPLTFEILARSVVEDDGLLITMSLPTISRGKGILVFTPETEVTP